MDVGDIVSREYLVEQGYVSLWVENEGKSYEKCVYHSRDKQLDLKIQRVPEMPEIYKVMIKVDLKLLKEVLR